MADKINAIVSMKQAKRDWQWWKAFKTLKIQIPENLDKVQVFTELDKALNEVQMFENDLFREIED